MKRVVSVVIPVYNVERYLRQCVDSVLKQTVKEIEIILVDDGSKDDSGQLCDELQSVDERIRVFHKENGGLSSARNYGMSQAKGEYILFLDSDDYIDNNCVEFLLKKAIENQLDMISFSGQCFWDRSVRKSLEKQYQRAYKKRTTSVCSGYLLYNLLKVNNEYYPAVPMHFYRLDFLKMNHISFKEGILHEDELFSILTYYYADRAVSCSEILYLRRMREHSIMSEKIGIKNVNSCLEILYELIDVINKEKDITDEKWSMIRIAFAHCLWLFFLRFSQLHRKEKEFIRKKKNEIILLIRENNYFDSKEIKKCFLKRYLLPFRNNKMIYQLFDAVRQNRRN